jgi:hypothetical protein
LFQVHVQFLAKALPSPQAQERDFGSFAAKEKEKNTGMGFFFEWDQ